MLFGAIFEDSALSDADAFSTLLTVQSLLFAVLAAALTLSGSRRQAGQEVVSPATLGKIAAGALTLIGVASVLMWTGVFLEPWECDVRAGLVAIILLVTIIGEVVFAWLIARALGRNKPPARSG